MREFRKISKLKFVSVNFRCQLIKKFSFRPEKMGETSDDDLDYGVGCIREAMKDEIPTDLDTDFNLHRWWHAYNGDIQIICEHFRTQIANRRAAGYDNVPQFMANLTEIPEIKRLQPYISMSRKHAVNERDNSIVFIEAAVADPGKLVRMCRASDYIRFYHACCEYFLQIILEQERKTGKPSQGICIYDMSCMKMLSFINPMAPINRLLFARVQLWQDFYAELLRKVIIVNAPVALSAVWKIMSWMIHKKYHTRFVFVNKHEEIFDHLDASAIPRAFGGKFEDTSGYAGANTALCYNERTTIKDSDLYQVGQAWKQFGYTGATPGPLTHTHVGRAQTHVIRIEAEQNSHILWHWRSSGELQFSVVFVDDSNHSYLVHPQFKLVTPKVPEEDGVKCTHTGTYELTFENTSHYVGVTLQHSVVNMKQL